MKRKGIGEYGAGCGRTLLAGVIFAVLGCGGFGRQDEVFAPTDSVGYYIAQSRLQPDSLADRAFALAGKAMVLAGDNRLPEQHMFEIYVQLATTSKKTGNYDAASAYFRKALNFSREMPSGKLADVYFHIADIANRQEKYDVAMEYFLKVLQIRQDENDVEGIAASSLNIGSVYQWKGDYTQAEKHYRESLDAYLRLNDLEGQARCYNNLGGLSDLQEHVEEALQYYRQSEQRYIGINHPEGLATVYSNMGRVLGMTDDINEALRYYRRALSVSARQTSLSPLHAQICYLVGDFFNLNGQHDSAIFYFSKAIETGETSRLWGTLASAYAERSRIYAAGGRYRDAYTDYIAHKQAHDTLNSTESVRRFTRQSLQYEFDVMQQEQLYRNRIQRIFIIVLSAGTLLIVFFTTILWRNFVQKRKMNRQLSEMNLQLSRQQKDITDSINAASLIQQAILPREDYVNVILGGNCFILNKPRNTVSGDFYWMKKRDAYTIVAVADCTGHGVQGAVVSILGISLLDKIVSAMAPPAADGILNQLRSEIIRLLNPETSKNDTHNGMDISLAVINNERHEINFAGAFNSIYLLRGGELTEYKANHMPVGTHDRQNEPFTAVSFPILPDDTVYMFSDGFADQFGGKNNKRFMSKRFRELIRSLTGLPIADQAAVLEREHAAWKGDQPQTDDILVVGIKPVML
ncbi:MAG: tetratricopeptide repeat protein [Bacteroidales bacterium]|jgi:serine phosphatase RsbU (regulator of sigma subunit)/tetratricopeptide (TPR) repeat protein|nr:tetratricopeptide repeat protein [Bacteroidales bacterium]